VLLLGFSGLGAPGTRSAQQETSDFSGDAHAFLDGVLKRYATAKSYHFELVEETQNESAVSRTWFKFSITAIVLPDKRYRFENHSNTGDAIQVSDGVSEWFYLPQFEEYTKGPAPSAIPGPIPRTSTGLSSLGQAQRILRSFSYQRSVIQSASYLPDEKIDVDGKPMLCVVVQADALLPRQPGITARQTQKWKFWIDKKEGRIWKTSENQEGPIIAGTPRIEYTQSTDVWFRVSEPNAQSASEDLFVFKPREGVKLVPQFVSPQDRVVREIDGKVAPSVDLVAKDGKTVSLKTFLGKPVLLDFWATWCAPCVEALPAVEKLYNETAGKGLVLLGIDDDQEAQDATNFLAKRKESWPNFHMTEAINDAFPPRGIPYLVLIDASGRVVYSSVGFDEAELRNAIAKLGPPFADVSKSSTP
jgi:thiol-disulfide isomerase/thioredoxin